MRERALQDIGIPIIGVAVTLAALMPSPLPSITWYFVSYWRRSLRGGKQLAMPIGLGGRFSLASRAILSGSAASTVAAVEREFGRLKDD